MKIQNVVTAVLACSVAMYLAFSLALAQNQPKGEKSRNRSRPDAPWRMQAQEARRLAREGRAAWRERNDTSAAESCFRQALSLDQDDPFILVDLACLLDEQGRTHEAVNAYRAMVHPPAARRGSTFETNPAVLMRYAALSAQVGDWQEAAYGFDKAMSKMPLGSQVRAPSGSSANQISYLNAISRVAQGRDLLKYGSDETSRKAVREFSEAVRLQPKLALAQYHLGEGLRRVGRRQEAEAAFRKAAQMGQGEIKAAAQKALR